MTYFPKVVTPKVPPIKTHGIKTKLTLFIADSISWNGKGRWIEPFLGSGAVLLNLQPQRALVSDINKYIIGVYKGIQLKSITPELLQEHFEKEGAKLQRSGGDYYYKVRERFNNSGDLFDFMFLNRACFNGLMRFNNKGGFNAAFNKRPERFTKRYIKKVCDQVAWASDVMQGKDWTFVTQDWRNTIAQAAADDFVYMDPPYEGREARYFGGWSNENARELALKAKALPCSFAYSMLKSYKGKPNEHLKEHFAQYTVKLFEHFYFVGGDNKGAAREALVLGCD